MEIPIKGGRFYNSPYTDLDVQTLELTFNSETYLHALRFPQNDMEELSFVADAITQDTYDMYEFLVKNSSVLKDKFNFTLTSGPLYYLHALHVGESYRGKGISSILLLRFLKTVLLKNKRNKKTKGLIVLFANAQMKARIEAGEKLFLGQKELEDFYVRYGFSKIEVTSKGTSVYGITDKDIERILENKKESLTSQIEAAKIY